MEMLHGGDLFQQISTRTNISESYLSYSFKSAVLALRSVHEKGYIHRDLKLDNLMVPSASLPPSPWSLPL